MGRSPYCKKKHTKKCAWNKKKHQRLINYVNIHAEGCWRSLTKAVGLLICGKSCKLGWIDYVPPDLKRVIITEREAEVIIRLQSLLGNKWSLIAVRLPESTDKEIKNYWKTHLKRKLYNRGLDPQMHRPLDAPTAVATVADPVAVVNNNDDSKNNNNGKFQKLELEQYISCFQASSFSQREICDPPIGDGGSASVHVASNRVSRALNAVKKEDAACANPISESTSFSIWEKGERIGAGGYGTVYVARNSYKKRVVFFISDRETGALCAVKELKDIYKLENIKSIQKEIKILSPLEHTNVVKYYGHEIVGCHISLYMEYVQPGSLKKYILEQGVLPELLIRNFTGQILFGLAYLHSKRVVHRDIKPDNLLVSSNNIVKLGDFGLAKQLEESVGNHSMLGTPYYAAPEVFDKKIEYQSSSEAYAADIWSLGCVIIEMFSGNHPWPGFDPVQVIFNVHVKQQHPPIPEKLCRVGKDLLELCFTRTPADRPSASALLDHPFVKPPTTSLADGRKYN